MKNVVHSIILVAVLSIVFLCLFCSLGCCQKTESYNGRPIVEKPEEPEQPRRVAVEHDHSEMDNMVRHHIQHSVMDFLND